MRDIAQAAALDIDTTDMVVVTHPDKTGRYGGPAQYTMTDRAFAKRRLASRGFTIEGRPDGTETSSARELQLEAEVERLRSQIAATGANGDPADDAYREELLAQARDLGIPVRGNPKTETLERKIAEATGAPTE